MPVFQIFVVVIVYLKKNNLPITQLKSHGWGQHIEILTYVLYNSKKMVENTSLL